MNLLCLETCPASNMPCLKTRPLKICPNLQALQRKVRRGRGQRSLQAAQALLADLSSLIEDLPFHQGLACRKAQQVSNPITHPCMGSETSLASSQG